MLFREVEKYKQMYEESEGRKRESEILKKELEEELREKAYIVE